MGLYFKLGIALFFLFIIYCTKSKIIKLIFNKLSLTVFVISVICGFICILICEKKYDNFYKQGYKELAINGIIVSNTEETEYYNKYIIKSKTKETKGKNFILYLPKNIYLEYGDLIEIDGEFTEPEDSRNYKGFDYKIYLKTKNIYGIIKAKKPKILAKNQANFCIINKMRLSIKEKIDLLLPSESASILNGLLIGIKYDISDENSENFSLSSLSHLLAISGTHIVAIIFIFNFAFSKIKIPTRIKYIFLTLILLTFIVLTGFAESVVRASISSIILILSKTIYKKRDILISISFPIIISLIYNPYLINSISLQLSYLAVIGVIYISPIIQKYMSRYIPLKLSQTISITLGSQIAILPIMLAKFNIFSFTFVISNLLAIPVLEICIFLGIIMIFFSYFFVFLASKIAMILNFCIQTLILITKVFSNFSIHIITLDTYFIVLYYAIVLLYTYYFYIKNLPIISLKMKYKLELNLLKQIKTKKVLAAFFVIIIGVNLIIKIADNNFKIYFIDQRTPIMIQILSHLFVQKPLILKEI